MRKFLLLEYVYYGTWQVVENGIIHFSINITKENISLFSMSQLSLSADVTY